MGVTLVANHPVHGKRRFALLEDANVGSAATNDLRLEPPAEPFHARILYRDGRLIVTDLKTAGGTYVDGRLVTNATIVRDGQEIRIGDWIIRTDENEPVVPVYSPEEQRERDILARLAANPSDDALRQVYGDWLEENGRSKQAEVLSLEREIRDGEGRIDEGEVGRLGFRLRQVSAGTPLEWRALVTRPRIETCNRVEICPRTWDRLTPLASRTVLFRHCEACGKDVMLTEFISVARRRVSQNERVAVDVTVERYPRDLEVALARVATPPAPVEAGVTALPFFAHDQPPSTVGPLLRSLGIDPPEELGQGGDMGFYRLPDHAEERSAPPPSPLVRSISVRYHWDMYHQNPRTSFAEIDGDGYEHFHVHFAVDGDLVENWLRARFGAPREAVESPRFEGHAPGPSRVYGAHWIYDDGLEGGCELRWESRLPDWALAPTDKNAALRFLNELSKMLRRPDCTHAQISEFASRPPARSGLVVTGPLNRDDFWLRPEPKLSALEVAHALEVDEPIGSSSDVHMSRWSVVERNPKSRLGYPRYGRWIIDIGLDGWPSGGDVPNHYAAKELRPKDLVYSICIRPFMP